MPDIYTSTFSTPGMSASTHETEHNKFCCTYDEVLLNLSSGITIVNADKISDGSSYFIGYVIHFANYEVRRRYSEFESLRVALAKLYPTVLVPPIPDKHSIAQYATKQTRAKEDSHIIEKRKRMLQSFLNRIVAHPILQSEHVFHRFLERDTNWSEVLNSPPLSTLPKNPLSAPSVTNGVDSFPIQPSSSSSSVGGTPLFKPSPLATLKNPDPHFIRSEEFTNRFQNLLSGPLYKAQKGLSRRLADSSKDLGDLGAIYNGFSLTEAEGLAEAIEKAGQAVDVSYMALAELVAGLEEALAEPIEEYIKYSSIAQRALKHRTNKHLQLERAGELLTSKRLALERLELAEQENKRLAAALQRETEARDPYSDDESVYPDDEVKQGAPGTGNRPRSLSHATATARLEEANGDSEEPQDETVSQKNEREESEPSIEAGIEPTRSLSAGEAVPPGSNGASNGTSGGGHLLNLLSYTLHGLIDVDPEGYRRSSITKTKEQILGFENCVESLTNELELTSAALQRDLDRFQAQKETDIAKSLADVARRHRDYCLANLEAWEEALAEAEKIPTGNIPCRAYRDLKKVEQPESLDLPSSSHKP